MIRLSEVSIRFKRWLIRNGEIDIPSGRVTLIKGLSGTGKTTLLYRIGLISKDQYYKYRWNKTNVNSLSYNQRNEVRRNHIGYVFQDFCLFDDFSVYENIEYYSRVASIHINEQKVKELLKSVWLEDVIFQPTYTLSGGEKQRLAIACALVKDPELLVLDEPTSALDEENERNVFSILRTLAYEKGKTVVVASHSYIADDYADCIYTIDDQKIVCQKYEESQEEIKTHSSKHELSFVPYYLKQYFKKHSFMNILMVFIILGGCLCSIYIQGIIQQTLNDVDDKINKFSNHQIAIFNKNVDINVLYNGTDISQSIIDRLSKNDHVRSIYPMYNLTVEVGSRQYPVFPLFDENRLEGKLFSKTLDERHAYLSYLLHYENPEKNKVSRFIFNDEIEVEEDVDVSGVLSIGKKSEFSGNLSYVMMDYDEIERIAKANHIKPTKCAYVLFMKDIESVREVENIVNEYRLIRINTFQNALELLNMKNNTILTMKSEKTFVKILTVLLFLYLGYWNIKGREKEFVLLYINGISLKELVGIMMSDLLMKLCIAFALSIGIGYILSMIHILEMNFIELINYFIVIGSIVGISMLMMTCYFVKKLDPERILRN